MPLGASIDATSNEVSVSSHSLNTGTDTACNDNTFHSAAQSLASTPQQDTLTLGIGVDTINEENIDSNIDTPNLPTEHNLPTVTIADTIDTSAVPNEPNTEDGHDMLPPPATIPPINLTQDIRGTNEKLPIQIIDQSSQEECSTLSGLSSYHSLPGRTGTSMELLENEESILEDERCGNIGDGGDSDEEGEEGADTADLFDDAINDSLQARMESTDVQDDERNFVHAPDNWSPPTKPDTYHHVAKPERGEPQFCDLDNPGGWDDFSYQPKYDTREKGSKYLGHYLPTGATVVPKTPAGKRFIDGYEFFYNGWKGDTERRNGATVENLFPPERKGMLDADKLKLHGLTKDKMCNDMNLPDAAFFYQLLLPFCDPEKLGIPDDKRKAL